MSKHGSIWWSELQTTDAGGAADFYTKLIGWQAQTMKMGDPMEPAGEGESGYVVFMNGEDAAGGMMKMDGPQFEGIPPHWMTYITVDDVDAAAAKVEELGGTVLHGPFDVPKIGRIAIIKDPQGAVVGLGTPVQGM